jgi:hypothetical protein
MKSKFGAWLTTGRKPSALETWGFARVMTAAEIIERWVKGIE